MKNFREEQINSTTEHCINQYWEKEVEVGGVLITFYFWKRKKGCKGYFEGERIEKIVGVKDGVKKRITSTWITSLGEDYCTKQIISRFS